MIAAQVSNGLQALVPQSSSASLSVPDSLRIVDNYVKVRCSFRLAPWAPARPAHPHFRMCLGSRPVLAIVQNTYHERMHPPLRAVVALQCGRCPNSMEAEGCPPLDVMCLRLAHGVLAAQAFYIPWGAELSHWAQSHPEYTAQQVESLIAAIADTNGIKRRERVAVLAEIQGELALS